MVTVRRVVTGHDADGKSIIATDGPAPQFHGRPIFAEVWNTHISRSDLPPEDIDHIMHRSAAALFDRSLAPA
jgi:hypothetical protein